MLFADQAATLLPGSIQFILRANLAKLPTAALSMEPDASAPSAPSAVAALAASAGAHGMEDARENLLLVSNAISPLPAESLTEDNLPAHSAGRVTPGFPPHGEAMRVELVPGKKYQVRQAPSGGYGIYEVRSRSLCSGMQRRMTRGTRSIW